MSKKKISSNEISEVSTLNEFNTNDIPRCIKCNLICSINLNYIGNYEPRIIYECENGHYGNISLEEYLNKYNNFSLLKEKCSNCGKVQKDSKGDFFIVRYVEYLYAIHVKLNITEIIIQL